MKALVRVRGVVLAVPRNKDDQTYARRILTEAFRSPEDQERWEQALREYIAQGRHVSVSTYLLIALELRSAQLALARANEELRDALLLQAELQAKLALLEATPRHQAHPQLIAA